MSDKAWKLVLSAVVLALALPGSLAADEAAVPEVVLDEAPEAPVPAEEPALLDLQPAPLRMTDCYSLSTCTTTYAACESWCYGQDCGVHSWDATFQICNCGTQM